MKNPEKYFGIFFLLLFGISFSACSQNKSSKKENAKESLNYQAIIFDGDRIEKTEQKWQDQLSDLEYNVLRKKGTERAFSNEYWDNKEAGVYRCRACELDLYTSDTKFHSGTGWPSFWQPVSLKNIEINKDSSLGMQRDEVACARCGSHLGHVFNDGPKPTGMRYCMNSAALNFVAVK